MRLLWELNDLICTKNLEWCLAHIQSYLYTGFHYHPSRLLMPSLPLLVLDFLRFLISWPLHFLQKDPFTLVFTSFPIQPPSLPWLLHKYLLNGGINQWSITSTMFSSIPSAPLPSCPFNKHPNNTPAPDLTKDLTSPLLPPRRWLLPLQV